MLHHRPFIWSIKANELIFPNTRNATMRYNIYMKKYSILNLNHITNMVASFSLQVLYLILPNPIILHEIENKIFIQNIGFPLHAAH